MLHRWLCDGLLEMKEALIQKAQTLSVSRSVMLLARYRLPVLSVCKLRTCEQLKQQQSIKYTMR